jgi:hypothetical protein
MSCKNNPFSEDTGNNGSGNVVVRGEGEIFVREVNEGDKTAFYVTRKEYIAPGISLAFNPASIEKGKVINKDGVKFTLNVTEGRDVVKSIQVPIVNESVTNPVLPYVNEWNYPSTDPLANEEELAVSATVEDSRANNVSAKLKRPTRIIIGAINKDPRVATVSELKAAAANTTDGQPGILVTDVPNTMTFPTNNNYWFVLVPTVWSVFNLKDPDTGFVLSPIRTDKGAVVMNTTTSFSQQYTVCSISSRSAGPVTFEKI